MLAECRLFREPPRLLRLAISGIHVIISEGDDKFVSLVAGITYVGDPFPNGTVQHDFGHRDQPNSGAQRCMRLSLCLLRASLVATVQ